MHVSSLPPSLPPSPPLSLLTLYLTSGGATAPQMSVLLGDSLS